MDAGARGAYLGRKQIARVQLAKTTVADFGAMARESAKQHYKSPEKQADFVRGWQQATQEFFKLLKDYPTQRHVVSITLKCRKCGELIDVSYEDEREITGTEIHKFKNEPCPVCHE